MSENPVGKACPVVQANSKQELEQSTRYICFGEFHIDQQTLRIFRGRTRLKLNGKSLGMLITLIKKHGQVVSRDEIKQALWTNDTSIRVDTNLSTYIHMIRKALEMDCGSGYVLTIPGKGYMFDAIPEFLPEPPVKRGKEMEDDSKKESISIEAGRPAENLGPRTGAGSGRLIVILVLCAVFLGAGLTLFVLANRDLHLSP